MANNEVFPPAPESSVTTKVGGSTRGQRWPRLLLVLLLALGIVGITWTIGQTQGWSSIGTGGVNAQLLPKVGESAPDLFTITSDGQPVLLSSLRGQPVWLNFWGSWCPPCRAEMPDIEAAYKNLQPQGLVMLGIGQREPLQESVTYAKEAGATYPILADPALLWQSLDSSQFSPEVQKVAAETKSWQINNFPTHIFIDRNGIVQAVVITQLSEAQAINYGETILNVPYTGPAYPSASPFASPAARPAR
jgi:thiol-disulfide isomerase/thioredoxin